MSEPYEMLSDDAVKKALESVDRCERVIDAGVIIGKANAEIEKVLEAARSQGKLEKI